MNQNKLLNYLLAAMIVWVPNQLHLPADLGVKGLNSINLLFLAILYFVHQRNKRLPPSDATPMKGVFIAYFCMLGWAFLAGQLSDPSLMMDDLTALKNSVFFMCLYFVFFHAVRDETSLRYMFYTVLFVAAVAGLEAIREGIDYGFGVYGETKRAAGPFGTNYKASNLAAVFYSMFMPVFAAVALYQKGRPLVRWGGIGGVGILLLAIFCTYSRQAYLIVAAMLLLMTMKRNVVLGLLILLAVVNYESWVPEGVVTRLAMTEQVSEETGEEQLDESTESRFILWEGAGRLLLSRPWGIGLNHFKREIGNEAPGLAGLDAHNFLVLITTEGGIGGGIMTLVLYGALSTLAWRLWKLAKTADQRTLAAGYAGATVAVMLGNLYGSRLLDGAVTGNYWILTALAARYWVMLKNGVMDETVEPGSENAADSDAAVTGAAAGAAAAMGARQRLQDLLLLLRGDLGGVVVVGMTGADGRQPIPPPIPRPLHDRPGGALHQSCHEIDADSLRQHEDGLRLAPHQLIRGFRLVHLKDRPLMLCDHYRFHSCNHTGERHPESNRNRPGQPS